MYVISYENHDDSRSYILETLKGPPATYRSFVYAKLCADHMRLPGYRIEELRN